LNWIGWQVASLGGIVLAAQVPLQWGLGFAGVLALVGILCSLCQTRMRAISLVVSGAAAVVAFALPLRLNILVAIAAAVAVCLVLEQTSLANNKAKT
jgi:predicted branched-subunit amino acid permease